MKTLKVSLLLTALMAFLSIGAIAQVNPQFGPIPGNPYNYLPASNTPMYFTLIYTDPVQGSACYNPVVGLFNPQSQTGWACVIPNSSAVQSQGTWQVMFGTSGLNAGITTLASAATIAPLSQIITLTGAVAVTSITNPASLKKGAIMFWIATGASSTVAGNDIGNSVTFVANTLHELVWDGSKWWVD